MYISLNWVAFLIWENSMNIKDNIKTKIENLCSAMEAGDHKVFTEIISSEKNWKKAEEQLSVIKEFIQIHKP